jgi:predicted nucleic-acid-binding Zn-ribbon protein
MKKKDVYLCPKCGSINWKFATTLQGTTSMINITEMVNNLWECVDCGYIGVFFQVNAEEVKKIQEDFKKGKVE